MIGKIVFVVALVAAVAPLLISWHVRGWISKYDSPPFSFDDIPDLNGKTVIVTGTNTGIGFVTARELVRKGAHVIATARSSARGNEAVSKMKAELGNVNGSVEFLELDLASFQSVKDFSEAFSRKGLGIDMLILNAGVMMSPFSKTENGFELQFGTNFLGHFLLVKLLLPIIELQKACRVVHVSSLAHEMSYSEGIRFDSFDNDSGYDPLLAYGQSKLANILFSNALSRRFAGTGLTSNSLHPGTIKTELVRHVASYLQDFSMEALIHSFIDIVAMDVNSGAMTQLLVATSPSLEGVSGKYFEPIGKEKKPIKQAMDVDLQEQLWAEAEKLVKDFV